MSVVHVFTNPVADGTITSIVRPSDWNSAHYQYLTASGNTAGQSTFSGSNIVIGGGPNITISGVNATRFDISAGAGGAGDGVNILAAGTQTANTTGTVNFANSNGITFGMSDSSQITASHNGLTSQSNQAFSAAGGSSAFQTLTFNNANGVSFSNNGGAVEASIATSLTNIRLSAGTTSNLLSAVTFANANGLSFGLDAGTVTASYTVPTVTNSSWTVSDNGTSGTVARLAFTNLNGVTLSLSTGAGGSHTIVGSHNALTSQSNQNVTAGNGGFAFQTLSFSNANGVSFGTSAGSAITGSVAAQTNQTGGIYVTAQSTGQSSSSTYDVRTLSFVPDGIISAGWSNGSFRVSATQSNQAFSAGAASSAFQTLSFQDSNGFSFSNNAGAIRVSYTRNVASNAIASVGSATNSGTNTSRFAADDHVHAGVFSVGVSNVGNTAGDTRVDVGRFVLAGGANITLSQATAANALNTISIVGATAAPSPVNFSAGTTSNNLGSVVFSNSNGVSFGLNGSTITASAAGGAGATMSLWPPNPWGWSTAASTIYSGSTSANGASTHSTMSYYVNMMALPAALEVSKIKAIFSVNTGVAGTGSATVRHYFGLYTRNGDSISLYSSWIAGINYTQSSATSIQFSYWTGSASASIVSAGSVNSTAAITGPKIMPLYQGGDFILPADNYYMVQAMHSLSAGVNPLAISHAVQANTYNNEWGRATSATNAWRFEKHGAFSSTSSTNAAGANQWLMPSAIATTAISHTAAAHARPFPIMLQCGHN